MKLSHFSVVTLQPVWVGGVVLCSLWACGESQTSEDRRSDICVPGTVGCTDTLVPPMNNTPDNTPPNDTPPEDKPIDDMPIDKPLAGPWDFGIALPAATGSTGDPEHGRWALLHEGYVSCGIPWTLFNLAKGQLGSFTTGEPMAEREGKNAEVPHNWTVHKKASGAEIVSLNCLECHAGKFNGELILGLGKADVDYTQTVGGALGTASIPNLPIPGIEDLTKMMARYRVVGPYVQLPSVGTNPADMLAAILASHRDQETLAWLDEPSFEVPKVMAPVDTPPWWRVQKKGAMFYNGMARGDHRGSMMFASSLCTDNVEEAEQILSYFEDIRAYLLTLEAPKYPFAIDHNLAAEGAKHFATACAGCHGTYAEDPALEQFPNLLIPLAVVDTDPIIAASGLTETAQNFVSWFNGSFYGETTTLQPTNPEVGYVAPPLDGIWATAPFFHNASVPNLELVINSTARPKYWQRTDFDSAHFDQETVGWPFVAAEHGHDTAPAESKKFIYDTTLEGHSNSGHRFGDHLTPAERRAVLEYLKTL